jgi:drug/metabolite transporter (DMT)-like permease
LRSGPASDEQKSLLPENGPRFGLSDVFMLMAVVFWGVNFSVIKIALREMTPNGFNGWRLLLTAVLLLVLLAFSGQGFRLARRDWIRLLALGVAGNTIYQMIFIHGVHGTTASNSSLIMSTSPIFVALLSAVLRIERIPGAAWLGIFVSFLGIVMVILLKNGAIRFSAAGIRGDALILAGTLLWASYTVFAKPFLGSMSPLKFSAVTVGFGTLFYVPLTLKDMLAMPSRSVSVNAWASLVFSAVFSLVLGYLIWYYSVQRVGNARTAVYNNVTPLFTALFAAFLLGERLRPLQAVGAAIVLTGVWLTRSGHRVLFRKKT